MGFLNGRHIPMILSTVGSGEGDETKAALVRANATHELEAVGTHVYLLDESNSSTLDASCSAIYNETAEYIVFVKKGGKYYPAQSYIGRNKLYIEYNYYDTADYNNFKSRIIIWNPAGGDNKLSFESQMMYAQPEDWEDEDYYYTCAPTVEAVETRITEVVGDIETALDGILSLIGGDSE